MNGNNTIFKVGAVYEFFYHGERRIGKVIKLHRGQLRCVKPEQGYVAFTLNVLFNTTKGYRDFIDAGMVNVRKLGKIKRALLWLKGVRL